MKITQRFPQLLILSFVLSFLFSACSEQDTLTIAISKSNKDGHYAAYEKWVKHHEPTAECIDLYSVDRTEALKILKEADGLILSGGPDVHPDFFGKAEDSLRCEIDNIRDTLEFALIKQALSMKIPILGICRGEQILNVAMGGDLIVDIPEDHGRNVIHRCGDPVNCFHTVMIDQTSYLYKITGTDFDTVNTNHHQAVGVLAEVFQPVAISEDGIVEAYEWKNPSDKSFLIAVQWHPERMDWQSPLSLPIGKNFIKEAKKFKASKKIASNK